MDFPKITKVSKIQIELNIHEEVKDILRLIAIKVFNFTIDDFG